MKDLIINQQKFSSKLLKSSTYLSNDTAVTKWMTNNPVIIDFDLIPLADWLNLIFEIPFSISPSDSFLLKVQVH